MQYFLSSTTFPKDLRFSSGKHIKLIDFPSIVRVKIIPILTTTIARGKKVA